MVLTDGAAVNPAPTGLAILHIMRSPVGGLFRHVVDLAGAQAALGHRVGVVADSTTGGARAEAMFAALAPALALGLERFPMARDLGFSDWTAARRLSRRLKALDVDVVHGHGSKGGAYARLVGGKALKVYTPHGGSLHYSRTNPVGFAYLTLEQALAARTDLFLFESRFGRAAFARKVTEPRGLVRVVHNGVADIEFTAVEPAETATDLVFVGEMRRLKGVDVLIAALALLKSRGRTVTATIVGAGPDATVFEGQAAAAGLGDAAIFPGALPARDAFRRGRILVVPSRAESLPYVVLEAGACGLPQIVTDVGGVREIFGPQAHDLIPPGDASALANAIADRLDRPEAAKADAARLQARVRAEFSVMAMTQGVLDAYGEALARRG